MAITKVIIGVTRRHTDELSYVRNSIAAFGFFSLEKAMGDI
jgi:hypothetical protein